MCSSDLGTGKYVVAWASNNQEGVNSNFGIYGQLFGKDCTRVGLEFAVNSTTAGEQSYPVVAAQNDGTFLVAWQAAGQDGGGYGIYAQKFTSSAAKDGSEFRMNAFTTGDQMYPALAFLGAGGYVGAWQTVGEDEDGNGLKAQNFKADGTKDFLDYVPNITTTSGQTSVKMAGFQSGSAYVMAWRSNAQDGDKGAVILRLFK